jgi:hypothetical protein
MTEPLGEDPGYLLKTDHQGNMLWAKAARIANQLLPLNDGSILLAGNHEYLGSSFGFMKGDSLGNGVNCWIQAGFPSSPSFLTTDSIILAGADVGRDTITSVPVNTMSVQFIDDCISVSAEELDNVPFEIYPNPSSGSFIISNTDMSDVWIYDSTGRVVVQEKSVKNSFTVQLETGFYHVAIVTATGRFTRKLIVNR